MRASAVALLAVAWSIGLAIDPASAGAATQGRQLAAACAGCHLMEPQAAVESGSGIPQLAGLPEGEIVARMQAYRSDENANQVMHVVAGALSPEEITAIAHYLANPHPAGLP